jgi:hypothetical protein
MVSMLIEALDRIFDRQITDLNFDSCRWCSINFHESLLDSGRETNTFVTGEIAFVRVKVATNHSHCPKRDESDLHYFFFFTLRFASAAA